jgi:transcriptional regulator with XRE-family HTH domain
MKTNDISPFPARLKEARLEKRLSQKQLGILAGIDPFAASARMNQYERGVHTADFLTVKRIAEVLQLPTAYFFCEEDELAANIKTWHKQEK